MEKASRLLIALLLLVGNFSCGKVIRNESSVRRVIGPAGGRIELKEALLEVPPNALNEEVEIELYIDNTAPKGTIGKVFGFAPRSVHFEIPATLYISYKRRNIQNDVSEKNLRIAVLINSFWKPISNSHSIIERSKVVASIARFSQYGLIENSSTHLNSEPSVTIDSGPDLEDAGPFVVEKRDGGIANLNQCECKEDFECDDKQACTDDRCVDACHCLSIIIDGCPPTDTDDFDAGIDPDDDVRPIDLVDSDICFNQPTMNTRGNSQDQTENGYIKGFSPNSMAVGALVDGLGYPSGMAFDAEGNLYFGNVTSHPIALDIHKIDLSGHTVVRRSAVDTEDGSVAIGEWAFDLAIGPDGNVYFNVPQQTRAGSGGEIITQGAIRKLDPGSGQVSTVVDGIDYPSGLAFDADGILYFGNVTYHPIMFDIYKVGPDGYTLVLKAAVDTTDKLVPMGAWAFDLAISRNGDIYFIVPQMSDMNNRSNIVRGAIKKYNPSSHQIDTVIDDLDYPSGLAFDSEGTLYFGNVTRQPIAFDIHKVDEDGDAIVLESAVDTADGSVAIHAWAFDIACR